MNAFVERIFIECLGLTSTILGARDTTTKKIQHKLSPRGASSPWRRQALVKYSFEQILQTSQQLSVIKEGHMVL